MLSETGKTIGGGVAAYTLKYKQNIVQQIGASTNSLGTYSSGNATIQVGTTIGVAPLALQLYFMISIGSIPLALSDRAAEYERALT